ncbi:MAG: gamma-glutamyltransferase [Candidatus Aminicenantes bacterium]|nr:gamma-glutamyltransferase [Candidatus Aminicenantes bacterium]
MSGKKIFVSLIALVALVSFKSSQGALHPGREAQNLGRKLTPAVGTKGMVSSAHPLATQAGLDILKAGGNAFDAAVAIAAMLNVVEPMNSGIGGYGTILVYEAEKRNARFLDSSGKIPINVDSDAFRPPTPNYKDNRRGPKAVSTPGNVNAWWAMSSEYGKLKWSELFKSAIKTAEQGFEVKERLARSIEYAFSEFNEHGQEVYGKEGKPLGKGDVLVQKDLAKSLGLIAEQGAKAVYGGKLGKIIDKAMRESGGFLTIEDLVADRAEWWKPISINYRGYKVATASPPSTAFPSLIRLGLMSCFDNFRLGHNSPDYLHFFAEATKHAFWCRLAHAGDPEINPPPLEKLLSEEYWEDVVSKIDHKKAKPFSPPRIVVKQEKNTTHFVVADRWGNIVSATQTLGNSFGCRIMVEGTGIWLNNSLAYCTFEPKGNPMDAHAGHRKLSGDCPTIIFKNGKPWAALGTPGGHTIGQTVPQMVMNLIDFKMDIQKAIAAPRISFAEPDLILVENRIEASIQNALREKGHNVREVRGLGNAHGLMIEYDAEGKPARFYGAADVRGNGLAKGY